MSTTAPPLKRLNSDFYKITGRAARQAIDDQMEADDIIRLLRHPDNATEFRSDGMSTWTRGNQVANVLLAPDGTFIVKGLHDTEGDT